MLDFNLMEALWIFRVLKNVPTGEVGAWRGGDKDLDADSSKIKLDLFKQKEHKARLSRNTKETMTKKNKKKLTDYGCKNMRLNLT